MIKLIVSDIDGTLVPEGNTDLNPEYLEVIKKLTEKGITLDHVPVTKDDCVSTLRKRIERG